MTDDHAPIELSWDHHPTKNPTIRFSIEPITLGAGTLDDPHNLLAAPRFRDDMVNVVPTVNMDWFDHFDAAMNRHLPSGADSHPSRVFWAFDFDKSNITAKAYFFPASAARATRQRPLDLVSTTIAEAPYCTPANLGAWSFIRSFLEEQQIKDVLMVAIDLLDPLQSRVKIYFRDSRISFSAVAENMTLRGRIANQHTDIGLKKVRGLWDAFLGQRYASDHSSLPEVRHQTAGMLYLAQLRLGDRVPQVKVYLPVRHYASNDLHVMRVLQDSMQRNEGPTTGGTSNYTETMLNILYVDSPLLQLLTEEANKNNSDSVEESIHMWAALSYQGVLSGSSRISIVSKKRCMLSARWQKDDSHANIHTISTEKLDSVLFSTY